MIHTLPVVLCFPRSQKHACARLADYCRRLDGTEPRLIMVPDELETRWRAQFKALDKWKLAAALSAHTLNHAALAMKGKPFIWLEHDSVPLCASWALELSEEYARAGKEFLLSSDSHPPHDMVGGIGVYGPDTWWLVPKGPFKAQGWDRWMQLHLGPLIHWSPLVQHSYGIYSTQRNRHLHCEPHRFPRDRAIIRKDACVFHRDKFQDLIPSSVPSSAIRARHTGDLGDLIAFLPTLRAAGGGELLITPHGELEHGPRERMTDRRAAFIIPLIGAQSYVTKVSFGGNGERPQITHDFALFRRTNTLSRLENLACWQGRHFGIESLDLAPWLDCEPARESRGKIVVSRSARYHNEFFPWRKILRQHRQEVLFVGLPQEHAALQQVCGFRLPAARIGSALDMARIIKGSKLFIGNQSLPCWIAMGLGHPLIQETCESVPDSIVPRENARFIRTREECESLVICSS